MTGNIVSTSVAQALKGLHQAPRTEEISRTHSWVLTRSRYSKETNDDRYSVHFYSTLHATSGITVDDVARQAGLSPYAPCQFIHSYERVCLSRQIDNSIDLLEFSEAFEKAHRLLKHAETELEVCGMHLYLGDAPVVDIVGDGHHVTQVNRWLEHQGDHFKSVVVRVEYGGASGWITHYKFMDLSTEQTAALTLLGLRYCESCGQYDFEPCHWRFTEQDLSERLSRFSTSGPTFQRQFEAQKQYLLRYIDNIVSAHHLLEPFGIPLVLMPLDGEITLDRATTVSKGEDKYSYDVAISFAGADRKHAEELSGIVKSAGYTVFYDADEDLWGVDLAVLLSEIYATKARFCIVFVSPEYAGGKWTVHEFDNALARAIDERGKPYILPIIVRDAKIPGLRSTIAYQRITEKNTIGDIAQQLIRKIGSTRIRTR